MKTLTDFSKKFPVSSGEYFPFFDVSNGVGYNSKNESDLSSNKDSTFKVYLIDSDSSQRAKLARLIFACGFHVEIFSSVEEFLDYPINRGVVFISDSIDSRGISGVIDQFFNSRIQIPIVAYREHPSIDHVISAMRARVANFLPVELFESGLREVLEAAVAESKLNHGRRSQLEEARKRLLGLTRRERQVIDMISDGLSNKEIGRELAISPRTVEIHRMKMLAKLAARSSSEAIKIWCAANMH